MALRLCNEHNLETGSSVFGKQVTYRDDSPTLTPPELLSDSHWEVKTDGYTNRALLIDRCILHSVSSGFFQETHVPLIDDMRLRVRESVSSHESLDYIVVDVSTLVGGSGKARRLYMKSLKDWYERFPFRMYIMYGANTFMRTAARLASPFMPFKVIVANDIGHALKLIREDKHLENKEKPTPKPDPIQGYQEEFLAYIGGIDWEKEGSNDFSNMADQSHPFYDVFQAIKLIKNEVDDLFKTRRQIQERLEKSENKYRELFEKGSDLLCTHNLDGTLIDTNIAFKRGYGWDGELPPGTNIRNLVSERYRHLFDNYLNRIMSKGHDEGTMMVTTATGREIVLEYNNVLVKDDSGNPMFIQGSAQDITDRVEAERESKKLQEQLKQKHKMEAITTLAGGVAHEFNNALMGIMGNIELLKMDLPKDEGRDKYFEAMKDSGHRMSRLTAQLLAYAKGGKYQAKNLKLDDFVIQTLPILQHDLSPEVRVETHFPKDISVIKADYAQMQMVLSAILANSNEAIENEGLIRITAGNKNIDENFSKQLPGLKPGPYVCLTIEDDGKGMDEETKDRIFEPFFTTKFQGRGMGMAAVYGIVKNHDGWISVDSELGKGTVVRIYLPVIDVGIKEQGPKEAKEPERELAIGEGTILVIEDEEVLLEMNREILERLGYRVLQAKTGREGVEIAKTFDGQIDLALLDIKLPDMSGTQVYPLIMEARPDLKVVVCSGYSIDGPARKILDAGAEGFIQKPFLIAALAEKLKEVLEGK